MAFVRWRGNSAALLATVYDQGKSRKVVLAALGCGYRVPTGVRESVAERFPNVTVDWDYVFQSMAKGPKSAPPLTERQLTYVEVEQRLREWASETTPFPGETQQLLGAANVLSAWRSRLDPQTTR